jgi:hypothetical protein
MIEMPKRSVTRFFVPLIDVLILLFCMFLLLPFVSRTDEGSTDANGAEDAAKLKKLLEETKDKLKLRDEEIRQLMEERSKIADRASVYVLEIDGGETEAGRGKLYFISQDGPKPERREIKDQAGANQFIARAKQKSGSKRPFFLILHPRTKSRFPDEPQLKAYANWFQAEEHTFDNPWATRAE